MVWITGQDARSSEGRRLWLFHSFSNGLLPAGSQVLQPGAHTQIAALRAVLEKSSGVQGKGGGGGDPLWPVPASYLPKAEFPLGPTLLALVNG